MASGVGRATVAPRSTFAWLVESRRPTSQPATPPAAAPLIALSHTFRSLLIASSNLFKPMNVPAANPAPAPTIVHTTFFVVDDDFGAEGVFESADADAGSTSSAMTTAAIVVRNISLTSTMEGEKGGILGSGMF
jgi:hypothetical protein